MVGRHVISPFILFDLFNDASFKLVLALCLSNTRKVLDLTKRSKLSIVLTNEGCYIMLKGLVSLSSGN